MSVQPQSAPWEAFRARLLRWLSRRVGDPADAEDLAQEVLTRAAARLDSLRDERQLVPWLDAMTRNALVDYYRRRGRVPELVALTGTEADSTGEREPDSARSRAALAACLRPMLDTLPERYREAVRRVDLDGERQVDVAAELGLGISTLKSRVQRGRAMLREAFTTCCALDRDAAGQVMDFHPRRPDCPAAEALVRLESAPGRRE